MLFRLFSCTCVAIGLGLGSYSLNSQLFAPQSTATRWVLHTLDGKRLPATRPDTRPRLLLSTTGEASQIRYQGEFRQSAIARLLAIPHLINTMMRYNDQMVRTELRYLTVLEQTTRFEVSGATLRLFAARQAKPLATLQANGAVFPARPGNGRDRSATRNAPRRF